MTTPNDFLRRIISLTIGTGPSRHRGYMRVPLPAFKEALIRLIEEDGTDIIELLDFRDGIDDLKGRLRDPRQQVVGRMLQGITGTSDEKKALSVDAREFNLAAENYYRVDLKRKLLRESFQFVKSLVEKQNLKSELSHVAGGVNVNRFLNRIEDPLLDNSLEPWELRLLINICLTVAASQLVHSTDALHADASIH